MSSFPEWQLQVAKARFREVFQRARSEGPQRITCHGREAVVVVAAEEYDRLAERQNRPRSLAMLLAESPLKDGNFHFERVPDYGRDVEL